MMRQSFKRIRCLLQKELVEIRRDRRLFGILIMAPLIQLIVFGYAATTEVREVAVGIRDNDRSFHSREFVRALESSGYLRTRPLDGADAADDGVSLVSGRDGIVVVIPAGFGERLLRNEPSIVQVLVDGSDSNFAVHGMNYLFKAARQYSAGVAVRQLAGKNGAVGLPSVTAETRIWYNPELLSRFYMVPGVMGVLLLVTTMIVSSMSLVKERETGTMEQIIVTPLRAWELIAGKLLPFVVIGLVEISLAFPVILLLFGVPFRGNVVLIYALSGLFLLTTIGLGLLVSTLVRTQQQAMLVSAFFVMLPFVLLSGFIFPVENMPESIQAFARMLPLKYYLTIVRGIFLKGAGLSLLWQDAILLMLIGVGIFALAVTRFHRRLD